MIYMMVGIQGSGKSTFAKKLSIEKNCEIISTDQVRKDFPGIKEDFVWPFVYEQVSNKVRNNLDCIFDATNITPKVRKRFIDEVKKFGVTPIIGVYYLKTDVEVCHRRVIERNKDSNELYLPPEVVYSYNEKIVDPVIEEGFEFVEIIKN